MQSNKVSNYLPQAILVTILCSPIFGIVAIIYAVQVNSKLQAGDYEGAVIASENAKKWCWISFIVGVVSLLLLILASQS